jgi:predicted RNA-binding protein with TRAM domain
MHLRTYRVYIIMHSVYCEDIMSYGRGGYGGGGYGGGGNRFGGGGGNFGPKPVETGKEYEVQISETSRKGDGIARVQGFVIFVTGGKVGQKVKVRVTNVGARFATAEVVAGSSDAGKTESQEPATDADKE